MTKTKLILAFFLSFYLFGQAQQDTTKIKSGFGIKQNPQNISAKSFWMEWAVGIGISSVGMEEMFRVCIGTTLSGNWINAQHRMFSIRGGYHRDQPLMAGFMGSPIFEQEIGELGVQLGKTYAGKYMRTSLLFGLTTIFGVKQGEPYGSSGSTWSGSPKGYMRDPFFFMGIPLTIKTAFSPKGFGLGIALDANLNPHVTYITLKLNFIFGDIRK
jgi:hypothetical protein